MDIKPENLISLLQQHKPLPQAQVLLLCGEEDYYRNSIIAALPEYVFGDTPEADREITVFDKDTNLSGLQAAVNSYPAPEIPYCCCNANRGVLPSAQRTAAAAALARVLPPCRL